MENKELLRGARALFEDKGFSYHSALSEIADGDIYVAVEENTQIETVATFNYNLESGLFESVLVSIYGTNQTLLGETTVNAEALENLIILAKANQRTSETGMSTEDVAGIINTYGEACRGDWSDLTGKDVRDDMGTIAEAVRNPGGISRQDLLSRLNLCPDGNGHWQEHCTEECSA